MTRMDEKTPEHWLAKRLGTLRWLLNPDFQTPQFLNRLSQPSSLVGPEAEPIRIDSKPRVAHVVRLPVPELKTTLIVKRYRAKNRWQAVKNCFRASRARHAFAMSFELARLNIPTAIPVAAGEQRTLRWLRDAYFISIQIEDASSLWESRQRTPEPQPRLFRQFGLIMARLHNAGLSHSDPTVSNFFVQRTTGNQFRIVLIDLDAIRRPAILTDRHAVADLRFFLERIPVTSIERVGFIAAYCRTRNPPWPSRQLVAQLAEHKATSNRPSLSLKSVAAGPFRWMTQSSDCDAILKPILNNPDAYLTDTTLYFKNTDVVTVARIPLNSTHCGGLVLRRLNYGKVLHQLRDLLRPTRARRAFTRAVQFERSGLATPRAFAATDLRRFGWPVAAYLLTEQLCGSRTLADFLSHNFNPPRIIALRLADLVAQLHNSGYSHRDLKFTNILLTPDLRPVLIDLDAVRAGSPRRAVRDLARFDIDLKKFPAVFENWNSVFHTRYAARRRMV